VLMYKDYVVPNWYINVHRIAYRDVFVIPQTLPLYYDPETWLLQSWSMKEKNLANSLLKNIKS
jgi:microcin C transport system substrate-binding protein